MKKRIAFLLVFLLLSLVLVLYLDGGEITGNAVKSGKRCLNPKVALRYIEQGCTRIYDSQDCIDKGKVEVSC